jgi:hypothetical protein
MDGSENVYSGFGQSEILMNRPSTGQWVISVNCMKCDGGESLFTIRIKQLDGTVLKRGYTFEPFGTVQLTLEIQ